MSLSSAASRAGPRPRAAACGQVDRVRFAERGGDLQPGQVDDLLDQPGQAVGLDAASARRTARRPRGRRRRRAPPRPAGRAPPTGVLSSWQTLATKSRRISSTPARLGAVLDEQQDVVRAERRDPGADDEAGSAGRALRQLQLDLADHAVAAYLPGQLEQLGLGEVLAPDQPVRDRGRGVVDDRSAESRTMPLDRSTARTSATPSGSAGRLAPSAAGTRCCWRSERRTAYTAMPDRAMPPIAPSVAAVVTSTPPG